MAKLLGTEVAFKACNAAMETMGAAGFASQNEVERCLRDARMLTVIDGTSGIQRLIIGRELLSHPAFT
jgi:alkylation response protein AidB-like acyl-CoA dehydrogenase